MTQTPIRGPGEAGDAPAAILLQVSETAMQSCRWRRVRFLAVLLNASSFLVGVWFVTRPRDRLDVVSAAGVAAAAVLSSAALTLPATGLAGSFVLRLRRIASFTNAILLSLAVLIVVVEALRDWRRFPLHEHLDKNEHGPHRDGRIGHVKRGPVVRGNSNVEKINHLAQTHPVDQVAHRAAQNQGQGNDECRFFLLAAAEIIQDERNGGNGYRQEKKGPKQGRRPGQKTKGGPGISHIDNVEETGQHREGFMK